MSDTVIVTTPNLVRSATAVVREERRVARFGPLLGRVGHGTVAAVDPAGVASLEKLGYQVTRYPNTNLLEIAGRSIDIANPLAKLRAEDQVRAEALADWPLHVVQLVAPAFPEWVEQIEKTGAHVIERAGRYGVHVHAQPDAIAAVRKLAFVTMVSPLQPGWKVDPRLRARRREDQLEQVMLTIYPPDPGSEAEVLAAVERLGGKLVRTEPAGPGRRNVGTRMVVMIAPSASGELANDPRVRSIAWLPKPSVEGEREVQILAENLDGVAAPATGVVTGYANFLTNVDADGTGVTVAIVDSGIDTGANNNTTGHLDLRGRQAAFFDYNGVPTDMNGHGTHVAGIAVGNAATGATEAAAPNDFLWGQGTAPGARYVGQSVADPTNPSGSGLAIPATATLTADAVINGATAQNNSWAGAGSPNTYSQWESDYDELVRDADAASAAVEPLTIVFAASNAGGLARTIGDPSSAKNILTVGNGLTRRPTAGFPDDDIRGIRGSSSRGPASGGRLKPDVLAPGTDVSSALSSASTRPVIAGTTNYTSMSGTSQAAPHVTGSCAVLTEWWRNRTGKTPSPAMLKALLINGAEDMVGGSNWRRITLTRFAVGPDRYRVAGMGFTPGAVSAANVLLAQVGSLAALANQTWSFDPASMTLTAQMSFTGSPLTVGFDCLDGTVAAIPNNDQGWGRISLDNIVFQTPNSDRGPRLFLDQRHAFTANGQSHTWRIQPVDTTRPLRVTLVWTDAPGVVLDNTPLVNDLDLEVRAVGGAATLWRGNDFANGFSTVGGAADQVNNVECVYLANPTGLYEVTVRATTLTADARPPFGASAWQDYALVVENAAFAAANPVSVSVALDRSGSMVSFGYVDVTRTASKLFVDLLHADDRVGIVSFGDTGTSDYADAGAGQVVQITDGTIQAAARATIDGLGFAGCTFMGAGLQRAEAQLVGAPGQRAIVLLSDGRDNKGCATSDPTRPWATDVAAALPSSIDVYTCAMGPAADQPTLESIAQLSGGRYYYMPTIDDLHEIYNFIRGNVTGDAVVVNTTSTASTSQVAAYVDCSTERAVFACHWHQPDLHWVGRTPQKPGEIQVTLRSPAGKRIPANTSWVHRRVGEGYVIFTLDDPRPGRWQVEVQTHEAQHTRYTVGGWVRSDLGLTWELPAKLAAGGDQPVGLGLIAKAGKLANVQLAAELILPPPSVASLAETFHAQLAKIRPDDAAIKDGTDPVLASLLLLDRKLRAKGQPSLFTGKRVTLSPSKRGGRPVPGLILDRLDPNFGSLGRPKLPDFGRPQPFEPVPLEGLLTHELVLPLRAPGSYTLRLSAAGLDSSRGCRFERVAAQSFVVGG